MPAPISRDYFISRTGADKALAIAIAAIIREAGFTTWLQDEDFGHASFMARMEQGFESGARIIALLSAAYQQSDYCREEYNAALAGDPLNLKERLIVLRVEDCAATGNLSDLPYVDLVPILAQSDPALREQLLRRAIRVAIGARNRAKRHRLHQPLSPHPQILHDEIAPVPGFTGREAELEALNSRALERRRRGPHRLARRHRALRPRRRRQIGAGARICLARARALSRRLVAAGRIALNPARRPDRTRRALHPRPRRPSPTARPPHAPRSIFSRKPRQTSPGSSSTTTPKTPPRSKSSPRAAAHMCSSPAAGRIGTESARELPLDVFSEAAALEFLMAQARGAAERPAETRAAAAQLAQDLGGLPLALAIARAHAWSMGWTFAQYRNHLAQMLERDQDQGRRLSALHRRHLRAGHREGQGHRAESRAPAGHRRVPRAGPHPARHRHRKTR